MIKYEKYINTQVKQNESKEERFMKGVLKQRVKARISVLVCAVLFLAGMIGLCPVTVHAAGTTASGGGACV